MVVQRSRTTSNQKVDQAPTGCKTAYSTKLYYVLHKDRKYNKLKGTKGYVALFLVEEGNISQKYNESVSYSGIEWPQDVQVRGSSKNIL